MLAITYTLNAAHNVTRATQQPFMITVSIAIALVSLNDQTQIVQNGLLKKMFPTAMNAMQIIIRIQLNSSCASKCFCVKILGLTKNA